MKTLSLIILTYNSEKDIYDCLESVQQYNDIGNELEVIVVDNKSQKFDTMKTKILQQYPGTIILQNTKNGGYGQGNNVGIRFATAPYIAIMNPDIRLCMPILKDMIRCLQQDNVAMCGGKQYDSNSNVFASFFPIFTLPWWFAKPLEYVSRRLIDTYFYKLQYLSGAFFAIKKDIMQHIGMFDENIFMYAEENDIHFRIRTAYPKMKMVYLKQLSYIHLAENRPFSTEHVRQVYISNGYFFIKNNRSPVKYWKQQIRLNNTLNLLYTLQNLFNRNKLYNFHRTERNQVLTALIDQYKHK